ncbi:MAG: DUF4160 domain-containing protein [Treponemataceae bacterium]|nr:MAG: DUF4160 domain-containing protein [Treponemataceae bacterium]
MDAALDSNNTMGYRENMPEISRFFGVTIAMHFNDHNPPHFHVEYGECQASIAINDFALMQGDLPARILGSVVEWASLHKQELIEDWNSIQGTGKCFKIKPLI